MLAKHLSEAVMTRIQLGHLEISELGRSSKAKRKFENMKQIILPSSGPAASAVSHGHEEESECKKHTH